MLHSEALRVPGKRALSKGTKQTPKEAVSHVSNLPGTSLRSSHPSGDYNRRRAGQSQQSPLRTHLKFGFLRTGVYLSWEEGEEDMKTRTQIHWKTDIQFLEEGYLSYTPNLFSPSLPTHYYPPKILTIEKKQTPNQSTLQPVQRLKGNVVSVVFYYKSNT